MLSHNGSMEVPRPNCVPPGLMPMLPPSLISLLRTIATKSSSGLLPSPSQCPCWQTHRLDPKQSNPIFAFHRRQGHDAGIRDFLGGPLGHEDFRARLDAGFAGLLKHVQW